MTLLVHLLTTLLVFYCMASYLLCAYSIVIVPHPEMRHINPSIKLIVWMFSPFVMLDIIVERLTGKGLL